jgi:hypothetical protein
MGIASALVGIILLLLDVRYGIGSGFMMVTSIIFLIIGAISILGAKLLAGEQKESQRV